MYWYKVMYLSFYWRMSDMKTWINRQVLFTAVVAGVSLGIFLKMVEHLTNRRVYTLLLNVDYFPILQNYQFPEVIEFSFHLVISLFITSCLFAIRNKLNWSNTALFLNSMVSQLIIAFVLFPTTILSDRTPAITDVHALAWWLSGHLLFGLLVGIFLRRST